MDGRLRFRQNGPQGLAEAPSAPDRRAAQSSSVGCAFRQRSARREVHRVRPTTGECLALNVVRPRVVQSLVAGSILDPVFGLRRQRSFATVTWPARRRHHALAVECG